MNPLYTMLKDYQGTFGYNEHSEDYVEFLLNNSLGFPLKNYKSLGFSRGGGMIDTQTEYSYNNFGYRDKYWKGNSEILALGCSNTFGSGVPVKGRWTNILGSMMNQEIRNLSEPGVSIQKIISQAFAYFKEFGNPKTIVCLFPDPFRLNLPINKNLIISNDHNHDTFLNTVHLISHNGTDVSKRVRYSKKPHKYEDVLPMELPLFFSMQSIHMLEQYCKSNSIKLVWTSWMEDIHYVFNNLENIPFDNFVFNEDFIINSLVFDKDCHENERNIFTRYFDHGNDTEEGIEYSHPGAHKHIHIAEAFYKEINK
jgi:hypothetical protein